MPITLKWGYFTLLWKPWPHYHSPRRHSSCRGGYELLNAVPNISVTQVVTNILDKYFFISIKFVTLQIHCGSGYAPFLQQLSTIISVKVQAQLQRRVSSASWGGQTKKKMEIICIIGPVWCKRTICWSRVWPQMRYEVQTNLSPFASIHSVRWLVGVRLTLNEDGGPPCFKTKCLI